MGVSKHELHDEFPQYSDLIDELRGKDSSFHEHFEEYAQLDQKIEGLERRDAPIGDDSLHQLKQQRVELKDDLYRMLVSKSGS